MTRTTVLVIAALVISFLPAVATGQDVSSARTTEADATQQPLVDGGAFVQTEREGTIVWKAADGPFSLIKLVHHAAPIIWFSPDEPLTRSGLKLPQSLPSTLSRSNDHVVYFNIPRLLIRKHRRCVAFNEASELVADLQLSWEDSDGDANFDAPPLGCLLEVKIRYFFYYESEVGVAAHANDFETLQINIAIEENGKTYRCGVKDGLYCAIVTGVFGSAHGVAWYTNGLNVSANLDTLLPLTILVEEGKHATAPDRNGDGVYTPGFDVDIHPNDAWGIRDTLRTRWLQGPGFSGDMAKRREPKDRVFPPEPNPRLAGEWRKRDGLSGDLKPTYKLVHMRDSAVDNSGKAESKYCIANSDRPVIPPMPVEKKCRPGFECKDLRGLLASQEGCRVTRILTYGKALKLRGFFARVNAGGTHDEFLTWSKFFLERWTPALRISGGSQSLSWVPPLAWNVPGLDGWVSVRWRIKQKFADEGAREEPLDLLYSLSASRYFSLYSAIGRDKLPALDISHPNEKRIALEAGFKWRFSPPYVPVFLGTRIGVRTVDPGNLRYSRLIFEIGGGSW
jgi:hypothetical protein